MIRDLYLNTVINSSKYGYNYKFIVYLVNSYDYCYHYIQLIVVVVVSYSCKFNSL